jgi:hypothetical protein
MAVPHLQMLQAKFSRHASRMAHPADAIEQEYGIARNPFTL